jgi:outer membrane protein OmpA-like peptidoglycan-associated protein
MTLFAAFRNALRWLVLAVAAVPLLAASQSPSTEQMIHQLTLPKTRSLRNLIVEDAPAAGADVATPGQQVPVPNTAPGQVARPSLSLLIQFDFDSMRIRAESQEPLSNLAKALQSSELQASRFAVEGHTDGKGNAQYNLKLSQQRASAIRDFLKDKGVDEGRLTVIGKGSTELANPQAPTAAENRRVKIVNLD